MSRYTVAEDQEDDDDDRHDAGSDVSRRGDRRGDRRGLDDRELPDPSDMDDEDDDGPDVEPCPYCRAEISEDADVCPRCGSFISREDAPWRPSPLVLFGGLAALAGITTGAGIWFFLFW